MSNPYEPPSAEPIEAPSKWAWNGDRAHTARIAIAIGSALTLVVLAEESRNATSPIWISVAGPFAYMERTDNHFVAWAIAMLSLIGFGAFVIWPRWFTLPLALLSAAAWLYASVLG